MPEFAEQVRRTINGSRWSQWSFSNDWLWLTEEVHSWEAPIWHSEEVGLRFVDERLDYILLQIIQFDHFHVGKYNEFVFPCWAAPVVFLITVLTVGAMVQVQMCDIWKSYAHYTQFCWFTCTILEQSELFKGKNTSVTTIARINAGRSVKTFFFMLQLCVFGFSIPFLCCHNAVFIDWLG